MNLYSKREGKMVDFGPIQMGSGAGGFYGEGYWFHKPLWLLGVWFFMITFVGKTMTLMPNKGNAPLKRDGVTLREFFPRCIFVSFHSWFHAGMLNIVALSNIGSQKLLGRGRLQKRKKPQFLSFMPIGDTPKKRLEEVCSFKNLLLSCLTRFEGPIALQINICPNTGHKKEELIKEVPSWFDALAELEIPLVAKLSSAMSVKHAKCISDHSACSALLVSNTLRWDGELPDRVKIRTFGTLESPLRKRGFSGGGAYSGKWLLPFTEAWIMRARKAGIKKPIVGGGGVLSPRGVWRLKRASADAIAIASISILRPWMFLPVVFTAHLLYEWWPKLRGVFPKRKISTS